MTILEQRDGLLDALEQSSDLIDRATADSAKAKPPTGLVHAVIGPPDITWDNWHEVSCVWSVWIISGTTSTQAEALDLLYRAMDDITEARTVNVTAAEPASWTRDGSNYAAYRLTIDKEE